MTDTQAISDAEGEALRDLLWRGAIHGGRCVTARGLSRDVLDELRVAGRVGRAVGELRGREVVVWWLTRAGLAMARQLMTPDAPVVAEGAGAQ